MSQDNRDLDSVDDAKMQAVISSFKIRAANWQEIKQRYQNWESIYKHDVMKALRCEQIQQLQDVFDFKGVTLDKCRNELVNWISQHKEFYNDNIERIREKIQLTLEEFNQINGTAVPYINWLPDYGGMIQMHKSGEEIRWRRKNNVPFALDGQVPAHLADSRQAE